MKSKRQYSRHIRMSKQELAYQIVINCIMVLVLIICIVPSYNKFVSKKNSLQTYSFFD